MDLFEKSDSLNSPIECFFYDAQKEIFPVKQHWHYFVEVIYMFEGTARVGTDDTEYLLKSGDMIFFHPKARHSIGFADAKFPRYAVLKFDIGKFHLSTSYSPNLRNLLRHAYSSKMDTFFPKEIAEKMECKQLFDACLLESKNCFYGCDMMVKNQVYSLLIQIIRYWLENGLSIESSMFEDENERNIENITDYIDLTLREGLRVQEIAAKCDMSYSNFAKRFREIYGIGCKEYIERLRVYKVEEFLLFTEFDLTYISQETGFADCSHMIKTYKKLRGVTPGHVRMQRRREQN